MVIYDKTGRRIDLGDFVVYGHALGRSAGLRFGKVLAIKPRPPRFHSDPAVSITVIGIEDDWSHREVALCSRVGTLQFPERTVVIEPERMPANLKALLDAFVWDKK